MLSSGQGCFQKHCESAVVVLSQQGNRRADAQLPCGPADQAARLPPCASSYSDKAASVSKGHVAGLLRRTVRGLMSKNCIASLSASQPLGHMHSKYL